MNSAKLRHQITIQSPPTALDAMNQPTGSYTTVATMWASIDPISGREYFAMQAVQSEVTHKITIRYCSLVKPNMQVLFGTRVFQIVSVLNLEERNIEMQIMCYEVFKG